MLFPGEDWHKACRERRYNFVSLEGLQMRRQQHKIQGIYYNSTSASQRMPWRKEKRRGYCWLLCHLTAATEAAAIDQAFVGYGHRWKIEEVHRQIKMDYDLEEICLQRYEALKSMNALLWTAASFLYTRLDNISIDIITHVELGLQNRKRWSDLLRFVYYKLALAVKKLLSLSTLYVSPLYKTPKSNQLCFGLGWL